MFCEVQKRNAIQNKQEVIATVFFLHFYFTIAYQHRSDLRTVLNISKVQSFLIGFSS